MPRLLRHQTFARNICNYFRALTKGAFLSRVGIKKAAHALRGTAPFLPQLKTSLLSWH